MYKNLVFKGGGVLGIAYAGAIKVLEERGLLENIEKVAGTSAGAMTAALVALKYSAAEVYTIVNATNFKSFEDGEDPLRLLTQYGLYKGDVLLSFIQKGITDKGLPANATYRDFKDNGCLDLHVFSTNLNTQTCQEFSLETTPDVIVAESIRASMSIPMFFKAWKFSNSLPDDNIYVDGGLVYNYPLTTFDTGGPNTQTLGFYLSDLTNASPPNTLQYDHLIKYIEVLFETMIDAQVIDYQRDPEMQKRTVMIDDLGMSATDFHLTAEQELALYQSGIDHTTKFFAA